MVLQRGVIVMLLHLSAITTVKPENVMYSKSIVDGIYKGTIVTGDNETVTESNIGSAGEVNNGNESVYIPDRNRNIPNGGTANIVNSVNTDVLSNDNLEHAFGNAAVKTTNIHKNLNLEEIHQIIRQKCASVDRMLPIYISHPHNCSLFFQCMNGVGYQRQCPQGLHFDADFRVCKYPGNAHCSNGIVTPPSNTTNQPIPDTVSTQCLQNYTKHPLYISDPYSCSTFFHCKNGVAYKHHCPKILHFDKERNMCNFPENVNCPLKHAKKNSPTGYSTLQEIMSSKCSKFDSKFPVYIAHPYNCSSFFQCSNGVAYELGCPPNLHFDSGFNVCSSPQEARCELFRTKRNIPIGYPTLQEMMSSRCPEVDGKYPVYIAHPYSCSSFFQCSNGVAFKHFCPKGLHFDTHLNVCNSPGTAHCLAENEMNDVRAAAFFPTRTIISTTTSNSIFPALDTFNVAPEINLQDIMSELCPTNDPAWPMMLRHPSDCSLFFICSNGVAHLQRCSTGLHFDGMVCANPQDTLCLTSPPVSYHNTKY